jgi:hypothetical protein
MRRNIIAWYAVLIVLFSAALAGAEVNVNINIGVPLPEVRFSAPPALAVIKGSVTGSGRITTTKQANCRREGWIRMSRLMTVGCVLGLPARASGRA